MTSSDSREGGSIMNMENQQAHFNHEDWLAHLYRYIETARQLCKELLRGVTSLSQKGLRQAWSEIRLAASRLTAQDFIITGLVACAGVLGILVFAVGLSLFGYQALLWLQDGIWTEFPLFVVFNFLFESTALQQWMMQPESWVGLQKMLSWFLESIPLSLALMIPGFSIALFMAGTLGVALLYRFSQLRNRND
jgi:hypothetical protein